MTMHETINGQFPIRKNKAQKAAFRRWAVEQAQAMGYDAYEEPCKGVAQSCNVVVGDPEQAEVVLTAHYDTPAVMPLPNFITPRNILVYVLYQLALLVLIFIPTFLVGLAGGMLGANEMLTFWLAWTVYMGILLLMMCGPANRHNANDNTSGVAAVMQLMQQLPEAQRSKAAFILFDNEEKGMLGSAAYAKAHPEVRKGKLLINMDCVGVGDDILFFASKKARALPAYERLTKAMENPLEGKQMHFFPAEKSVYPSDQSQFKHGVAVCACRRHRRIGFMCTNLHTAKDVLCDQACLDALTQGLRKFVEEL